jgi:hypothetical protein
MAPATDPMAAPPDVTGEVVYVGDFSAEGCVDLIGDLDGEPCIVIRTTREALKAGPPLVYRNVAVVPQPGEPT